MSLIQVQNLTFGYPDKLLFSDLIFNIEPGDRIGLIGANGTGKTTLFKLITGELDSVSGAVVRGRDLCLGIMEQYLPQSDEVTVYEDAVTVFADVEAIEVELESIHLSLDEKPGDEQLIDRQLFLTEEYARRDGLVFRAKTRSALLGLGFTEADTSLPLSALSGGQRSKLALCKLLLSDSNLILLDEPTNHLDIDSVVWLEDFLTKYKGAAVIISHDRFFLDRVTTRTFEMTNGRLRTTDKSYTGHKELMALEQLTIEREYDKATKEIKRIEGIIEQQKRYNQERNYITIASKQKQIERIKSGLVVPDKEMRGISFTLEAANKSGNEVLNVDGLSKAFGDNRLFSNIGFEIRRGERVFLLGPNGCGKSTLLKIIMREQQADSGTIRLGAGVRVGYYDQTLNSLNNENTVLEEVWSFPRRLDATQIRKALAGFMFRGDDVYKTVGMLSGGERARVALLKLMLKYPNFLILDEPTNHLDITSREALEEALLEYDGTILAVSHDRYLINKLAGSIITFTDSGAVKTEGNYDTYLSLKKEDTHTGRETTEKSNDYKQRKARESEERKLAGRITRLEAEISENEAEYEKLSTELSSPEISSDYMRITELTEELDELRIALEQKYELWEELSAQRTTEA